jgi:copper(I)-binding protein
MLVGLKKPLEEGGELPLTLEFQRAGAIDVRVSVRTAAPD